MQNVLKKIAAGVLGITMAWTSVGAVVPTQPAVAQNYEPYNTVVNALSLVEDAASAASTASQLFFDGKEWTKEFVLDTIAWNLAKKALQQVQRSTLEWINSGFQGDPAFVTDLEGFLLDIADEVAGDYIYGSELAFLCEPFSLDVRFALELSMAAQEHEVQCTLSGSIENVDNFLNGDFLAGGLPGWFSLTTNPSNNFYGGYGEAQLALNSAIARKQNQEQAQITWGRGFRFTEECFAVGETGEEECLVNLPGKVIADAVNFELSVPGRTLIEADEINEIVSALFTQLTSQALSGGLTALSRSGSDGSPSYLDRIGNPAYEPAGSVTTTVSSNDLIGRAITEEEAYRAPYTSIASRAQGILDLIEEVESDENDDEDETLPPGERGSSDDACSVPTYVTARVTQIRNAAQEELDETEDTIFILEGLRARYDAAAAEASYSQAANEEMLAVLDEFSALESSGQLHGPAAAARNRLAIEDTQTELAQLRSEVAAACNDGGDNFGGT